MRPRLLGLYALAQMERDGAIRGYVLAHRVAEVTAGSWKPGAGAIYPCLRSLVERGLARTGGRGRLREYRLTPAGRRLLRQVRRRASVGRAGGPDLGSLWMEVVGEEAAARFALRRLERNLDRLGDLVRAEKDPAEQRSLRREAQAILARGRLGLRAPVGRRAER